MDFLVPRQFVRECKVPLSSRVADLGCGPGHYLWPLARAAGEDGVVYGVDVRHAAVARARRYAQEQRLSNVEILQGDIEQQGGTGLADGSIDLVLLANTLFALSDRSAALQEAVRITASGGRVAVAEWAGSFSGLGPSAEQVVTEAALAELASAAGLAEEREVPAGRYHCGRIFKKV